MPKEARARRRPSRKKQGRYSVILVLVVVVACFFAGNLFGDAFVVPSRKEGSAPVDDAEAEATLGRIGDRLERLALKIEDQSASIKKNSQGIGQIERSTTQISTDALALGGGGHASAGVSPLLKPLDQLSALVEQAALRSTKTRQSAAGKWFSVDRGLDAYVALNSPMEVASGDFTITVSVWLSGDDRGKEIKTIVANKVPGCGVDLTHPTAHNGYSLSVNTWGTNDQRLVAEWGSRSSGCNKLISDEAHTVAYDKWTHVALSFSPLDESETRLWVNGEEAGSAPVAAKGSPRELQPQTDLHVGCHANKVLGFIGKVRHLRYYAGTLMSAQLVEEAEREQQGDPPLDTRSSSGEGREA